MKSKWQRLPSIILFICLADLAGAFNPIGAAAQSGAPPTLDTSRLPRISGTKEVFANAATTIFTSPATVAQAAEATHKLLTAAGWQAYTAPFTATAKRPEQSITMFKKGALGLNVFIGLAPGLGNATSVSYSGIPLPNDLPFPKDGTAIEYDPHRPLLQCFTAAPLDKTLTYYREALGKLGWSLWSARLGDKQPSNAGPGELTKNGASAYYVRDGKRPLVLTLRHVKEKLRVKIEARPMSVLERAHKNIVAAERRARGPAVTELRPPAPKPSRKAEPAGPKNSPVDDMAGMLKMAQRMMRMANENAGRRAETAPSASTSSDGIPRVRADNIVPIPLPETAGDVDYKAEDGKIDFDSRSSVPALAAFFRAEMKKRGWREHRSVINRSNMVVLDFSKSKDKLNLTIMKFGNHSKVSGRGSVLVAQKPKAPGPTQQATAATPSAKGPPLPMPPGAERVDYDSNNGSLYFISPLNMKAVIAFYRTEMKRLGWMEARPPIIRSKIAMFHYVKDDDGVSISLNAAGDATDVNADGSFLKSAAAKNAPPSADDLKVEEVAGLPVPKARESAESEKSPVRSALKAELRLALSTALDFYRRELAKRQWKESKGAVVADDRALLAFASPDGPAVLKLGRRAGHTTVDLAVKRPAAAAKLGLLPKPGQAKVVVGNTLKAHAVITIHKKTIKVGPEVGAKEPTGPWLDLPPGKYKVRLNIRGKPAQSEDVELGADETWGLIIAPGGLLPLHVY